MDAVLSFLSSSEFWKAIGALAIIVAAIWSNPIISNKLKDIKLDVRDNLQVIEKKVGHIEGELIVIKDALKENTELTAMVKTRKETIELLTTVVSGALEYINDVKLREFIDIKQNQSFNLI